MSLDTYALIGVWIVFKKYAAGIIYYRLHCLFFSGKVWIMENLKQFGYFLCWCFAVEASHTSWFYGACIRTKSLCSVSYCIVGLGRTLHRIKHAFALLFDSNSILRSRPRMFVFFTSMFGCLWLILIWIHLCHCNPENWVVQIKYHNVVPVNKNLNLSSFIDKQIFNGLGAFTEFFQLFVKFRLLYQLCSRVLLRNYKKLYV